MGGRSLPAWAAELVGQPLGPTGWREVDQELIDTFARVCGDHQWIHVDVERARRESPYGATIAHGNLTLALIDGFRDELIAPRVAMAVHYGYDRVRFPAPVLAGARVRGAVEIADAAEQDGGDWRLTERWTVEAEGGEKPVCVAESVIRVRV